MNLQRDILKNQTSYLEKISNEKEKIQNLFKKDINFFSDSYIIPTSEYKQKNEPEKILNFLSDFDDIIDIEENISQTLSPCKKNKEDSLFYYETEKKNNTNNPKQFTNLTSPTFEKNLRYEVKNNDNRKNHFYDINKRQIFYPQKNEKINILINKKRNNENDFKTSNTFNSNKIFKLKNKILTKQISKKINLLNEKNMFKDNQEIYNNNKLFFKNYIHNNSENNNQFNDSRENKNLNTINDNNIKINYFNNLNIKNNYNSNKIDQGKNNYMSYYNNLNSQPILFYSTSNFKKEKIEKSNFFNDYEEKNQDDTLSSKDLFDDLNKISVEEEKKICFFSNSKKQEIYELNKSHFLNPPIVENIYSNVREKTNFLENENLYNEKNLTKQINFDNNFNKIENILSFSKEKKTEKNSDETDFQKQTLENRNIIEKLSVLSDKVIINQNIYNNKNFDYYNNNFEKKINKESFNINTKIFSEEKNDMNIFNNFLKMFNNKSNIMEVNENKIKKETKEIIEEKNPQKSNNLDINRKLNVVQIENEFKKEYLNNGILPENLNIFAFKKENEAITKLTTPLSKNIFEIKEKNAKLNKKTEFKEYGIKEKILKPKDEIETNLFSNKKFLFIVKNNNIEKDEIDINKKNNIITNDVDVKENEVNVKKFINNCEIKIFNKFNGKNNEIKNETEINSKGNNRNQIFEITKLKDNIANNKISLNNSRFADINSEFGEISQFDENSSIFSIELFNSQSQERIHQISCKNRIKEIFEIKKVKKKIPNETENNLRDSFSKKNNFIFYLEKNNYNININNKTIKEKYSDKLKEENDLVFNTNNFPIENLKIEPLNDVEVANEFNREINFLEKNETNKCYYANSPRGYCYLSKNKYPFLIKNRVHKLDYLNNNHIPDNKKNKDIFSHEKKKTNINLNKITDLENIKSKDSKIFVIQKTNIKNFQNININFNNQEETFKSNKQKNFVKNIKYVDCNFLNNYDNISDNSSNENIFIDNILNLTEGNIHDNLGKNSNYVNTMNLFNDKTEEVKIDKSKKSDRNPNNLENYNRSDENQNILSYKNFIYGTIEEQQEINHLKDIFKDLNDENKNILEFYEDLDNFSRCNENNYNIFDIFDLE